MNKYNEDWFTEVLLSMKGSKRVLPKSRLKLEIENKIFGQASDIIPIYRIRTYVAIFLLLLSTNFLILGNNVQNNPSLDVQISTDENKLISNYNPYQ